MALKKARFSYTKNTGETVERVAFIKKVVFHYDEMRIETIYEMFASDIAQSRGAVPEIISQSVAVDLSNEEDLALVLSASERIWAKNLEEPLIEDFVAVRGRFTRENKSLTQLNAVIEEA